MTGQQVNAWSLRTELYPTDVQPIREIVTATGKFNRSEIDIAVELAETRLAQGIVSGYEFILAQELGGEIGSLLGYACYGPIPATQSSFDLYWIVVHPAAQGQGVGRGLLSAVEQAMRAAGGQRLYAETSGRSDYAETRDYYRATGFEQVAELRDFYAPGDDKVIFCKMIH